MDVQLFLEYLPWLREPHEKLRTANLLGDYEHTQIKRTTPIKRLQVLNLSDIPRELHELYENYSLENLHMLGTSFWSEPKKLEQGWGFADMSEVNLVLAPSGQIEAYAAHPVRGMPGATDCLGLLAQDLESYLEAILYGAFNVHHFISGFPDESPVLYEKTVLVAKHCALIAGGYAYYAFWSGLLGLPPSTTVPA